MYITQFIQGFKVLCFSLLMNDIRFISSKYLFICLFCLLSLIGLYNYNKHIVFFGEHPGGRLAFCTRSIWNSGSIESPELRKIYHDVIEVSKKEGGCYWQDAISLTKEGKLYPKQAMIVALMAVPFYALLGDFGLWLFIQIAICCIVISLIRIVERLTGRGLSKVLVLLMLLTTEILGYSYAFSYDIFGAAFIICGLDLAFAYPIIGAFLMSLSVFVRPSNVLLLPFLFFAWHGVNLRNPLVLRTCLGFVLFLTVFVISNYLIWGGVFLTSYHRIPEMCSGEVIMQNHPKAFELNVFLNDWKGKLISMDKGLIIANPILILFPLSLLTLGTRKYRNFILSVISSAVIYFCYLYGYSGWEWSGNRVLLPATLLIVIAIIIFLSDALDGKFSEKKKGVPS